MKEIIDGLNLPKQILDKSEKLLNTLFGEGFKELGGIFGDKMKLKRLKNQIVILNQANEIMEKSGLKAHQLNLKTLVPLIEKSSLEEDEKLQSKWAYLIANIASSPENGLEPKLIYTLSSLSSFEAGILDFLYEYFIKKREEVFKRYNSSSYKRYNSIDDVKPDGIHLLFSSVKKHFSLTDELARIYVENLESLGIISNEDPDIGIDNGFSDAEIIEDRNKEQTIELNLDVTANYTKSDDFYFTYYGLYFVAQCKIK